MDLDDVSKIMGISDAELRTRDTFKIREFAKDYWLIKTDDEKSDDINAQLEKITDMIAHKTEEINSIRRKYDAECGFCIVISYSYPVYFPLIYYKRSFIELANTIGAAISMDFCLDSDCFDCDTDLDTEIREYDENLDSCMVKSSFYIESENIDLGDVTKKMGIPDAVIKVKKASYVEELYSDKWIIETPSEGSEATFFQFKKLLDLIVPQKEKIIDICSRYTAECGFYIEVDQRVEGYLPLVFYEPYMISFAAAIKADIHMHYNLK